MWVINVNVIIVNKYKDMLMGLNIEVIKSMEGVFDVNEIIDTFSNFYFDRMLLDITAIKNYEDLDNLQRLSINLDMSRVILILDDNPQSETQEYLSKLISMGIYNFTRNLEGINYLLNHPNTYRDVAHIHNVDGAGGSLFVSNSGNRVKIIGVKNLTEHAGATTLTYMLKKHLEANYNVAAIEVGKRDFAFFEGENLVSTTESDLPKELMKKNDYDIIIVDLNNYSDDEICSFVLYLVEPSTIKLNKLIRRSKRIFEKLNNKKIVLNKSFITESDVAVFEYEAGTKVFYNIPCIDDRKMPQSSINSIISKMGLMKSAEGEDENFKNKLLGLFKF